MLIHLLKFIHLICTLTLLGSTLYCVPLLWRRRYSERLSNTFKRVLHIIFGSALLAAITGTFLVHPKHFTFHTPWIQAAYILLISFGIGIGLLSFFKKKQIYALWLWASVYFILVTLLVAVIHDAVTKSTFLL